MSKLEKLVEELSALRVRLNIALEAEKVRLSLGDLISKAVAVALLLFGDIALGLNTLGAAG